MPDITRLKSTDSYLCEYSDKDTLICGKHADYEVSETSDEDQEKNSAYYCAAHTPGEDFGTPVGYIVLPTDPLTLSVLKTALMDYATKLNLEQASGDRTDAPEAPEYGTAMALMVKLETTPELPTFGEYAPLDCEAGDGEIIDRDRAVLLPNFGYAHDTDCASQWSMMQEAK